MMNTISVQVAIEFIDMYRMKKKKKNKKLAQLFWCTQIMWHLMCVKRTRHIYVYFVDFMNMYNACLESNTDFNESIFGCTAFIYFNLKMYILFVDQMCRHTHKHTNTQNSAFIERKSINERMT